MPVNVTAYKWHWTFCLSLNMEFHQQNVTAFDVHLVFVWTLTRLFPWSKCSLRARVHDL